MQKYAFILIYILIFAKILYLLYLASHIIYYQAFLVAIKSLVSKKL